MPSNGSVMIDRKDTTGSVTAHIAAATTIMYFYANSTSTFATFPHAGLNSTANSFYITVTYLAA
jgi:hypothetical protein